LREFLILNMGFQLFTKLPCCVFFSQGTQLPFNQLKASFFLYGVPQDEAATKLLARLR